MFKVNLGTGANMQCQSYFMGLPSTRDFYADASGSKWPVYDVDKGFNSNHYYNCLLPLPSAEGCNGINNKAIKQKILEHEAVFRNQVLELHRVYRKQRELMDEIRMKESYQHYRQLNTAGANPISLQILSASAQKMHNAPNIQWLNPICDGSVSGPQTSQSHLLIKEKSLREVSSTYQLGSSSKNSELLESKCKKYQNKILDLQLPASEYIDSDDCELVEVETVSNFSSHNPKKISGVLPDADVKPIQHWGWLKSVRQEDAQNPSPSLRWTTGLADLNEPIQLEEAAFPCSEEFVGPFTSNGKILPQEPSGITCTGIKVSLENTQKGDNLESCTNILELKKEKQWDRQLHNDEAGQNSNNLSNAAKSSGTLHLEANRDHELLTPLLSDQDDGRSQNEVSFSPEMSERSHDLSEDTRQDGVCKIPISNQLIPFSKMGNSELFSVQSYQKPAYEFKRNPIAVQALPCFNRPIQLQRKSSKNLTRSSVSIGDITWLKKRLRCSLNSTGSSSFSSSSCHNSKGSNNIDLNASINGDVSPPMPSSPRDFSKSASKMVLKAPVSPENEECSPPRGESDESQLEIPLHRMSRQEDGSPLEEIVTLAAKSLVFLSSSEIQICANSSDSKSCDESPGNSLHWFAGVVFSMAGTLEDDFQFTLSEKSEEEMSCDGFDYFEAMTLKLAETKLEESCCHKSGKKVEESSSLPFLSRSRSARARAGRKWKDFQRDVLPCLASLSRYEVTEDLQLIEGLMMEAAGAWMGSGSGRRRNGSSRGKKRSCVSHSHVVENPVCSVSKQQQRKHSEVSTGEERIVVEWGKITRRRRWSRHPKINLAILSSEW